jgi:hypothetical protein
MSLLTYRSLYEAVTKSYKDLVFGIYSWNDIQKNFLDQDLYKTNKKAYKANHFEFNPGNDQHLKKVKYMYPRDGIGWNSKPNQFTRYFIFSKNGLIVAAGTVQQSPHEGQENIVWVTQISVSPDYKNQGLATVIVDYILKFCKKMKKEIHLSSWEPEGRAYLRKVFVKLNQKYGLKIVEKDNWEYKELS